MSDPVHDWRSSVVADDRIFATDEVDGWKRGTQNTRVPFDEVNAIGRAVEAELRRAFSVASRVELDSDNAFCPKKKTGGGDRQNGRPCRDGHPHVSEWKLLIRRMTPRVVPCSPVPKAIAGSITTVRAGSVRAGEPRRRHG